MMISHELRTPLNAVVSYLSMIGEKYGEGECVQKAQSAAQQLTEISDSMLDYSRISSGTVELKNGIIRIKDVILQVDQLIALKAEEKKQNYHFEIQDVVRQYLCGDSLRVALIFQNIMENAVKFTPEGGTVEAKLSEKYVDQEHVSLVFSCRDNGKGMSQEFTRKIDMAFHQSDPSYSRTHGGLGLGLFLTQFFVKLMDGTFAVESKEGEGSTFNITLPMRSPSIEELIENNIKCQQVRTIVCETVEYDQQMAKDTLKKIGVKAEIAEDIEKVKRKIKSRTGGPYEYGVCILNIDLWENYVQIIEEIAALENAPEIFALSADRERLSQVADMEQVNHCIYKMDSYFELFNSFITDFGEYKKEEKLEAYDFSNVHAMIVEDNRINAEILQRILQKSRMKISIFENGKAAVDAFEEAPENTYQVIFMDIQMPVMNGYEAAGAIRNSVKAQGESIPIIAVSANAFPDDVKMSLSMGMNAHLAKPVNEKLLFSEVEKYCSGGTVNV